MEQRTPKDVKLVHSFMLTMDLSERLDEFRQANNMSRSSAICFLIEKAFSDISSKSFVFSLKEIEAIKKIVHEEVSGINNINNIPV